MMKMKLRHIPGSLRLPGTTLEAVAILLALGGLACTPAEKSARGFRLPDGDPERGRVVFVNLQCHSCHTVSGLDLPRPTAEPPVGVDLGGVVPRRRTDGELVTAIINPSHKISPRWAGGPMREGGQSRMGSYGEAMTVQEMVDLVAFLHSRYEVVENVALR